MTLAGGGGKIAVEVVIIKKLLVGLLFGALVGLIDIMPMLAMKLPLAANLSAFSLWVVVGLLITITDLKLNSALKGTVIALLVFLPSSFLIGQNALADLSVPLVMTVLLGSLLGWLIERAK